MNGFATTLTQILKTTNGGTTWTPVTGSYWYLRDICFTSTTVGYAVGGSGNILLQTTDGGTTWTKNTSIPYDLYSISFADANTGWVCGSGIYKTTNAGSTWSKQTMDYDDRVLSVCFLDKNKGYAAGVGGQIWNTTNGGSSWSRSWPNVRYDLTKICFVSPTTGWIVGQYGTILKFSPTGATGVIRDESTPALFSLSQNYPNPFNPSTTIRYTIPHEIRTTLTVYNLLGQRVTTLVDELKPSGSYEVTFHTDRFSSGIYLYTLQAGTFCSTKKLILMK
jgi:photosystem II stability/assembly factor-like uncharacterized protein